MALPSLASAQFVLDVQGLDGLKRAASQNPKSQIKAAATQFEALFLGRMLKSMRDAGYKSSLVNNQQIELYQSLFDQQLAQTLAGRGMGLADMLVRQMSKNGVVPGAAAAKATASAAIPRAAPRSLAGVPPAPSAVDYFARPQPVPGEQKPQPWSAVSLYKESAKAATAAAPSGPMASAPKSQSTAGRFVQRFLGAARTAAQVSGVPTLVILAQAALETGWGKHEVAASDGAPSHNLFGVKAGAGWKGATANGNSLEYIDGCWLPVQSSFRTYGSDMASFLDHAELMAKSPRYAAVREAATPEQAAQALQDCGYATDPRYADKLIAVMRQIGPLPGA